MLMSPYGFMIYYHNNKEFIEMKEIKNTNINSNSNINTNINSNINSNTNINTNNIEDYIVKLNDFDKVMLIIKYFT